MQSPSGSRAEETWPDEEIEQNSYDIFAVGDFDGDDDFALSSSVFGTDLAPGQLMSPKVPPAFDGRGSWFAFEELVYDWIDITKEPPEKHGPMLKQRLCGDAAVYKSTFDRELLKEPNTGVEYFFRHLRPNYVKGVQNVFLYRLMQFLSQRRGKLDIHRWIAKFELQRKKLHNAWMDLVTPITNASPRYAASLPKN